jgi:hypothetical protein
LFVLKPLIRGRIADESRRAEGMAPTEALAQASATEETRQEKHLTGVR